MKNNLTAEEMRSPLDELLDEISPIEQRKTDARMLIAARIDDAMRAKGWKNKDLMEALGRNTPSIITKWLSGTHNFTTDTLVELEDALGISLLNLRPEKPKFTAYAVTVNQKATDFQVMSLDEFLTKSTITYISQLKPKQSKTDSKESVIYF
jgi:ribosome-binding protein aMBF1 (putative translation factor)